MKKKIIGISLIVILTVITFYIVLGSSDVEALPELIHILNPYYLLMAIGCMVLYMITNGIILYIISKEITDNVSLKRAFYLAFIGQYYSAITPFAGGGQPMQIMILKNKYHVSIAKGTTVTVKKFVLYQVVISLLSMIAVFYNFDLMMTQYSKPMIILIFVGLVCHMLITLGIIMLAYTDVHIKKILSILLRLAHKVKLFRKTTIDKVNTHLDEYVKNIHDIKKNKTTMVGLFFITLIQIILFFSVTYFVYRALGQNGAKIFDLIFVQVMVYMVSSVVPTPGNVGASEGSFYVILQPFFPTNLIFYAIAIWRVITFYGIMLVSGGILLLVKGYETFMKKTKNPS